MISLFLLKKKQCEKSQVVLVPSPHIVTTKVRLHGQILCSKFRMLPHMIERVQPQHNNVARAKRHCHTKFTRVNAPLF